MIENLRLTRQNTENQIHDKKRPENDQTDKVERGRDGSVDVGHPIHQIGPALVGDALEDGQHGQAKVVKVGDSVVGSFPRTATDVIFVRLTMPEVGVTWTRLFRHFAGDVVVARLVHVTAEQFQTDDGIDDDHKQHEQGNVQQRNHRLDDGIQDHLKGRHARHQSELGGKNI